MSKKKYAIFSCKGLGDGLIALVLGNNLSQEGHEVVLFHPFLQELQSWFPHTQIKSLPAKPEEFDRLFFFYEKLPPLEPFLKECEKCFPNKVCVLNPIATARSDYPYWENGRFDGNMSFVDNLYHFCKDILQCSSPIRTNGILPPPHLIHKKFPKRVILHPTSSRAGKNWSQKKYLLLADRLEKKGFTPSWILSKEEKALWPFSTPSFDSLSALAEHIYESGFMIGNDSGIGHLASCLGLPTITLCRNKNAARFWHPAWGPNRVITPSPWLPNIKWFRYRDKHWQQGISIRQVEKVFLNQVS